MPTPEIEEFARKLIKSVRDQAIQQSDTLLEPQATGAAAKRWKRFRAPPEEMQRIVADTVDQALFYLLVSIDNSDLSLTYTADNGKQVDLASEGFGELAGWYLAEDGWRAEFSSERVFDELEGVDLSRRGPPK
jgi:hypothetical protein